MNALDRIPVLRLPLDVESVIAAGQCKTADALNKNPQLIQYEYVQRLPADTKVVVTDGKTIVNLGDVLNEAPTPEPRGGRAR